MIVSEIVGDVRHCKNMYNILKQAYIWFVRLTYDNSWHVIGVDLL